MTFPFDDEDSEQPESASRLRELSYEIGAIRPPSEGGSSSLLIRATRNCPWSKCGFCYGTMYHRQRFSLRPVWEIKADIDAAKAIADELHILAQRLGYVRIAPPLSSLVQNLLLQGKDTSFLTNDELMNLESVFNVFYWLAAGQKTVFLQDADTLIMPAPQLIEVIKYLKETFPSIERITSYARSKTITHKTPEELSQLHRAGLSRLHVGLETGDDELLSYVNKGVTAEEHIQAGKKAIAAGFELSEYVMPGLGGRSRSAQHAVNTARVLNEINPHFIRMRPFVPREGTPMFDAYLREEYELTSPHERLQETRLMVESLQVTSRVCFDHNMNPSYRSDNMLMPLLKQNYSGYKFPEEKEEVLTLIDRGLQMDEKAFIHVEDMMGQSLK